MADRPPVRPLLRRADFLRIAREGTSAATLGLIVQGAANRNGGDAVFLGFTVSAKVGKAVARNRVKRRLREAARAVLPAAARAGNSYVVIGRRAGLTRSFDDLKTDLRNALDAVHRKIK
jgi:ribonuclease P protein component